MEYTVCKQYSTCISCLLCVILFIQSSAFEDGDIRLMYNEREHESKGRLEVYYRGEWGTVCNSGWSNQDAHAACRQLHYRYGLAVWSGVYGDGSGPIWLHNVGCYSSRVLLRDCYHSTLGEHTCTHAQDVGVQCWNETSLLPIRLIDGDQLATSSGRVEVLFNEEWGSICVNWYWDHEEARTVCRQLGFTHGTAIAGTIHGSTGGRTWIGDLNCGADAAALLQCSFSPMNRHSCDHDAAVTCQNGTDIPIRLRDGSEVARSEGRVEIQYHGVWWSICADRFWSAYDATVICRELGYQSGYPVRGGMYGAAEERALMSELKCGRDISKLLECGFEVLGSDLCLNDRNAGVICVNDILSQFPVRIIGGSDGSDAYGRLELFKDNVWHSVCAATNNYNNNARVACRQLGYTRGHAIARGVLENKPERLWLPEFACTGSENSILECDFTLEGRRLNDCDYDAAIACWNVYPHWIGVTSFLERGEQTGKDLLSSSHQNYHNQQNQQNHNLGI